MPKSKKKKEKEQQDFKKVKLKVGKKISKGNETKTDFSARKIILRESIVLRNDPVATLLSSSGSTVSVKLLKLNNLAQSPQLQQPDLITGSLLKILGNLSTDEDENVRKESGKCIVKALDCLQSHDMPLDPSLTMLLTYVKVGLTHLSPAVNSDARNLFRSMISRANDRLAEAFIETLLPRLKAFSKTVSTADLETALDIVDKFLKPVSVVQASVPTFEWNTFDGYIPSSVLFPVIIANQHNITFPNMGRRNCKAAFKEILRKALEDTYRELSRRTDDDDDLWMMPLEEGTRLLVSLKLLRFLDWKLPPAVNRPVIQIRSSSSTSSKQKKVNIPSLTQEVNKLWNQA